MMGVMFKFANEGALSLRAHQKITMRCVVHEGLLEHGSQHVLRTILSRVLGLDQSPVEGGVLLVKFLSCQGTNVSHP
jgi:hypothetical protein